MNGDLVYCVMVAGPGLGDKHRNFLFDTAQAMCEARRKSLAVEGDDYEGVIETDWHSTTIGGIGGIVFRAKIDFDGGSTEVTYLVRPADIRSDGGYWEDWCPAPHPDPSNN